MVDFQSRDTSRGISDEEDDDEDEETEPDEETAETGTTDESEETEASEETTGANEEGAAADVQTAAGAGTDVDESEADSSGDAKTETETETHPGEDASSRDETASGHEADAPDGGIHADHDSGHEGEHGAEEVDHSDHDMAHAGHKEAHGDQHHDHEAEHGHAHADHHHADVEELGVAVVTVSSSRDLDHDPSGDAIQSLVEGEGHSVVARDLVADDLDGVQRAVLALTAREDVDVVVTNGGTGITPDDVTVEAVRPLFDKELPGFGELFRILSYEEVGTRALGTRATAGVSEGVPVFCLPGSEDAVRTGVDELILAEAPHLVGLARGE